MVFMATSVFRFLNIILAALLAGTSFGISIGFNPVNFSPSTYMELQQNTVRTLYTLLVSLVVGTTIVTIVSAILQRKNKPVFITLMIAAAFFITCILISRFGNKPVQDEMLSWNANSLPVDWVMLRDRWWYLHTMRTVTELIALVLIVWVSIKEATIQLRISQIEDHPRSSDTIPLIPSLFLYTFH